MVNIIKLYEYILLVIFSSDYKIFFLISQKKAWKSGHKEMCLSANPVSKKLDTDYGSHLCCKIPVNDTDNFPQSYVTLKLKNGESLEYRSGNKLPCRLSELDESLNFIIPSHEFLDIKNIPTPMFVCMNISTWLFNIDFVLEKNKSEGRNWLSYVHACATKAMATNHRTFVGATEGLPEAVQAWDNLMTDLTILLADHHMNSDKKVFGLLTPDGEQLIAKDMASGKGLLDASKAVMRPIMYTVLTLDEERRSSKKKNIQY